MMADVFTEADLRELLVAVGLPPSSDREVFGRSFDALGLDSLARMEMASRLTGRFGVNLEGELTPEVTPEDMQRMLNDHVSKTA